MIAYLIALFSGSFREFFGKIKGFPFPGLVAEGIICFRKNSAEFARYFRGFYAGNSRYFCCIFKNKSSNNGKMSHLALYSQYFESRNYSDSGIFSQKEKTRNSAGIIPSNFGISARNTTLLCIVY